MSGSDQSRMLGPKETARAFVDALNGGRWDEAAGYVHPEVARRHQDRRLVEVAAFAEMLAKGGPPRGNFAITFTDEDRAKVSRHLDAPVPGYRGAATLGDLAQLAPAEFMARTLENAVTGPEGVGWGSIELRHLGTIVESDDVAHALYREGAPAGDEAPLGEEMLEDEDGPADLHRVEVLALRRVEGRWCVLPDMMLLARGAMSGMMLQRMRGMGDGPAAEG